MNKLKKEFAQALVKAALEMDKKNGSTQMRDYLNSLKGKWDGKERIEPLLNEIGQ